MMIRAASSSVCGTYRYRLSRTWAVQHPRLLYVMLNPSTADGTRDDATIRRCVTFAQSHGFGALEVVNLFAFRATRPADLRRAGYPVGPDNDRHIAKAVSQTETVCLAWGATVGEHERAQDVLQLLRRLRVEPMCLGITRGGHPAHPLYLSGHSKLVPYTAQAISDALGAPA